MKHVLLLVMLSCLSLTRGIAQVVRSDFNGLTLTPDSYWDGSDDSKGFASGDAYFVNSYNADWGYWDGGFVYSNSTDVTTAGYINDFSAITGKDYSGDGIYAVAQSGAIIRLTGVAVNTTVTGFYLTNSTYATLSMENGDQFAKKFGGLTGDDPDYFKLIVTGYAGGIAKTQTVEAYLADFRNSDNDYDYILKNWKWVDLRPLGAVDSVVFSMASSDMSGSWLNTPAYFVIDEFNAPLFSPLGGEAGSTAISKADQAIVNWASACTVTRGPQDISSPASPLVTNGTEANAVGPATGTTLVSLGDGGSAVLSFEHAITNGPGADFAVFENGFTNGSLLFAELAFVEVSSDGENFFRFPAISNTSTASQSGNATYTDPRLLYNLAGSAQANYGTAFDLEELAGIEELDVDKITHVKIVDAVGSINPLYATLDKNGNAVNDPWKTDFFSSGFDLDAVAVLHEASLTGVISMKAKATTISVYPNPAADLVHVSFVNAESEGILQLLDITGTELISQSIVGGTEKVTLQLSELKQGVYLLLYNGYAQQVIKQ